MDIYELRDEIGKSGFDNVRIIDSASYEKKRPNNGLLFQGDLDDTYDFDCLSDAEITSIDIDFDNKTVTIDVDFGNADTYGELIESYEECGLDTPEGLKNLSLGKLWDEYDWEE